MDSGCSFHMCPTESWFKNLNKMDSGTVLLGNDQVYKVKGIGFVKIMMYDGKERVLSQVRYVPDLNRNLISLGSLNALGYEFKTQEGCILVEEEDRVVIKDHKINGLYTLISKSTVVNSSNVTSINKSELWHKRLRHIGEQDLIELSRIRCLEMIK